MLSIPSALLKPGDTGRVAGGVEVALWRAREAGTVIGSCVPPNPLWGLANCLPWGEESDHFQVTVKCACFGGGL